MMFYPMRQWDPFDMLERMLTQWDPYFVGSPWPVMPSLPQMAMQQGDQEILLQVQVPGISPEDLNVTVDGNLLTIRGVLRSAPSGNQSGSTDGSVASFERSFTLPSNVDPNGVKARYHQGILEIRVPRSENGQGRQIPIDLA